MPHPCHKGKPIRPQLLGNILDKTRCLIIKITLIADIGKRLHHAFPLDLAVIGQGVLVGNTHIIVNMQTALHEAMPKSSDRCGRVNAVQKAMADVKANGKHRIIQLVVKAAKRIGQYWSPQHVLNFLSRS